MTNTNRVLSSLLFIVAGTLSTVLSAWADQLTIMPLGDSITAGYGVLGGYRDPLYTDLTNNNVNFQFVGAVQGNIFNGGATQQLVNAGQQDYNGYGGWPIEYLTSNLAGNNQYPYGDSNQGGYWVTGIPGTRAPEHPDIVLLEIGTNNFLQDQGDPVSTFDQEISDLITSFHALSPNSVFLVAGAIPIEDDNGFDTRISAYDSYIQNTLVPSLSYTRYVNLYSDFTNADGSTIDSLYQADKIHPSQSGYDLIANDWSAAILQEQMNVAPEPSTYALVGFGTMALLILAAVRRKARL